MWKVYLDGKIFSSSDSSGLAVGNPTLEYELNKSASFKFEVPANHPRISDINVKRSTIEVIRQARWGNAVEPVKTIFRGFIRSVQKNFYGSLTVYCSDKMAFLEDSIQRPAQYTGTTDTDWETDLTAIVAIHNSQVDAAKRFPDCYAWTDLGQYDFKTNYETTMNVLVNTVANYGGKTWYDQDNDRLVVGMKLDPTQPANGVVALAPGMNILDLTIDTEALDLCTRLIPLGAKTGSQTVPGIDDRLTIASVNSGLDYVDSPLISTYGVIEKTVVWDSMTIPGNLKARAQAYLNTLQYENMTYQIRAAQIFEGIYRPNQFFIGNYYEVKSSMHNINIKLLLSKKTERLDDPTADVMTFGYEEAAPITDQTANLNLSAAQSQID